MQSLRKKNIINICFKVVQIVDAIVSLNRGSPVAPVKFPAEKSLESRISLVDQRATTLVAESFSIGELQLLAVVKNVTPSVVSSRTARWLVSECWAPLDGQSLPWKKMNIWKNREITPVIKISRFTAQFASFLGETSRLTWSVYTNASHIDNGSPTGASRWTETNAPLVGGLHGK